MRLATTAAVLVLVAAAAALAGYGKGHVAGSASVHQAWDREKAEQLAQHAAQQQAAREAQQQWQANADRLRQEKDREIRHLNARAAALAHSLRERPERAVGGAVPATAGAGSSGAGCTGAELSRPDAEFLAGEAARADELRVALGQCLEQYESLRSR